MGVATARLQRAGAGVTEQARAASESSPELVAGILRDILSRLDKGSERMGGIENTLSGIHFELARLKEQVTFANGRTGTLEGKVSQILYDELPAIRAFMDQRVEEVEGNIEAIQQARLIERAEAKGRAEVREEDRARLNFVWNLMAKDITKVAILVGIGAAGQYIGQWLWSFREAL